MELPKNVTQIGEADRRCKIYVEDYVISYIRQMNHLAETKNISLALYGTQKEEGEVKYLFFYGACRLDTLPREVRHLSQAQVQEVEKLRKKFFPDYQFLGYVLLNGEMVEGFHVCEQGICRYTAGYACFYEKNDAMLAYMLDSRAEEPEPEKVDQAKYERVRVRQETRRQEYQNQLKQGSRGRGNREEADESRWKTDENRRKTDENRREADESRRESAEDRGRAIRFPSGTMHMMRLSVAGMFLLLCIIGMASLYDNGGMEGLQVAAEKMWGELFQKKLPDSEDAVLAMNPDRQNGSLYTEDNLTDALQKENAAYESSQEESRESPEAETQGQDGGDPDVGESNAGETTVGGANAGESAAGGQNAGGTTAGESNAGESAAAEQNAGETTPGESDPGESDPGESDAGELSEGDKQGEQDSEGQLPSEETVETFSPIEYIIQKGDTLTGISFSHYGTDRRVREICELNHISNPDDIYFGQKILLP